MLALYRKYRPKSLAAVVGQPQVTDPLSAALKSGKLSHSNLFTGPRGCGKTSVARILAHKLNGFPYELEDSYLDIIEIDAASNTGVDNIRDLREKALIAPAKGKYKVYIIDEVHMLSKSAFNALLKTLEEPPAHVVFILATTDLEKVPVTITSRSQVFRFRLADPKTMFTHLRKIADLEKISIDDAALSVIARRGGGSFRDSLSLLDQISTLADGTAPLSEATVASALGLPLDSSIKTLLDAYVSADRETITKTLKDLLNEGLKPESLAEAALKSIIENPIPSLLPLLETLPAVSASASSPFPEAKLLLAFLSFSSSTTMKKSPSGQNIDSLSSNSLSSATKENSRNFREVHGRLRVSVEPEGRLADRAGVRLNDEKTPTEFSLAEKENRAGSLDSFLSTIQLANPAISNQLKKCKLRLNGTTLDIYPTQNITKTILSRKNNSDFLAEHLPDGFSLLIHDLADLTALNSDPKISKISDIMGNVEEVNENGGIPF